MILRVGQQRIFGDRFDQRRIGHQLAVAIAAEDRGQVEAEAVDVIVVHPMPQAKEDHLADDRMVAVDRVAAAGVVAVVLAAVGEHVVDLVFQPLEAERRAVLVAFGRVVEDHVEDHFDAGLVQGPDHLLELVDLAARLVAGRVAAMRREEAQRIVAPVVRSRQVFSPQKPLVGNSWTGISSTAVTPSDCR